ncbi:MAG: glutamate 5-kinase [Lachnospiraceae bacterium]|nr:glutamate 5-kinase [Lachnospiraceae bacterium]
MDREFLKDKKRIVVKIGTSNVTHEETGDINLLKLDKFAQVLTDIRSRDKDVIIVSSGAIGAGRTALGIKEKPSNLKVKQACAAVGQARLMMIYQKLFSEYNQTIAQLMVTKQTLTHPISRENAQNTLGELLDMGVIPIINENDPVSTDQIQNEVFGDNDTLSAIVAELVEADLLILLSDIDGLYTDNPRTNKDAEFIELVDDVDKYMGYAKDASTTWGTGGMITKLEAAGIATRAGIDMIICNGSDVVNISRILDGKDIGTVFKAN